MLFFFPLSSSSLSSNLFYYRSSPQPSGQLSCANASSFSVALLFRAGDCRACPSYQDGGLPGCAGSIDSTHPLCIAARIFLASNCPSPLRIPAGPRPSLCPRHDVPCLSSHVSFGGISSHFYCPDPAPPRIPYRGFASDTSTFFHTTSDDYSSACPPPRPFSLL